MLQNVDGGRSPNARQRAHPGNHVGKEVRDLLPGGVLGIGERHSHREEVGGFEPGIDVGQFLEAANELRRRGPERKW